MSDDKVSLTYTDLWIVRELEKATSLIFEGRSILRHGRMRTRGTRELYDAEVITPKGFYKIPRCVHSSNDGGSITFEFEPLEERFSLPDGVGGEYTAFYKRDGNLHISSEGGHRKRVYIDGILVDDMDHESWGKKYGYG